MKRTFEIEFPNDCGPFWMNEDNLLLCLNVYCKNTKFHVKDVTDIMQGLRKEREARETPTTPRLNNMKYINREDRQISHIAYDKNLLVPTEDSKYFHTPLCDKHLGILKHESTVTKKPKYRVCKRCISRENRKTATII